MNENKPNAEIPVTSIEETDNIEAVPGMEVDFSARGVNAKPNKDKYFDMKQYRKDKKQWRKNNQEDRKEGKTYRQLSDQLLDDAENGVKELSQAIKFNSLPKRMQNRILDRVAGAMGKKGALIARAAEIANNSTGLSLQPGKQRAMDVFASADPGDIVIRPGKDGNVFFQTIDPRTGETISVDASQVKEDGSGWFVEEYQKTVDDVRAELENIIKDHQLTEDPNKYVKAMQEYLSTPKNVASLRETMLGKIPDNLSEAMRMYPETDFEAFDLNDDGVLSLEEKTRAVQQAGVEQLAGWFRGFAEQRDRTIFKQKGDVFRRDVHSALQSVFETGNVDEMRKVDLGINYDDLKYEDGVLTFYKKDEDGGLQPMKEFKLEDKDQDGQVDDDIEMLKANITQAIEDEDERRGIIRNLGDGSLETPSTKGSEEESKVVFTRNGEEVRGSDDMISIKDMFDNANPQTLFDMPIISQRENLRGRPEVDHKYKPAYTFYKKFGFIPEELVDPRYEEHYRQIYANMNPDGSLKKPIKEIIESETSERPKVNTVNEITPVEGSESEAETKEQAVDVKPAAGTETAPATLNDNQRNALENDGYYIGDDGKWYTPDDTLLKDPVGTADAIIEEKYTTPKPSATEEAEEVAPVEDRVKIAHSQGGAAYLRHVLERLPNFSEKVLEGLETGELDSGGELDPKAAAQFSHVLELLSAEFPKMKFRLTGGHDKFHEDNKPESDHNKGTAFDIVVDKGSPAKVSEYIVSLAKKYGYSFLDEYKRLSKKATGKHFHINFNK